jgi:SAM-dependent methyltransferase
LFNHKALSLELSETAVAEMSVQPDDEQTPQQQIEGQELSHIRAQFLSEDSTPEAQKWDEFAADYDGTVYSVNQYPERVAQIISHLPSGHTLHLGCGCTPQLNQALLDRGDSVIATDFSSGMLTKAQENLTHPQLEYQRHDSRELSFPDGSFDGIVSVNSILPPERADVDQIFSEAYRVLRDGGTLVALLPAFDYSVEVARRFDMGLVVDLDNMREQDTTGWQCFHTPESIALNMRGAGFEDFEIKRVTFDSPAEISEISRLYGFDSSELPVYEHLLIARK